MGFFTNPFAKNDNVNYDHVLVPLTEVNRHASVLQKAEIRRFSIATAGSDKDKSAEDVAEEAAYSPYTIEGLRFEIEEDVATSGHDTVYDRKSKIINRAIQDIGMGRYNWKLFILCGFGWMADNLWLQGVALTLPSLQKTFDLDVNKVRYTTCALFVGLCIGASFWGIASDIIGRRLAFNMSLLIAGVFGLAVGGANSWIAVCGLFAALGTGVGGNLPVDGALFLEFLPFASGGLLTLLSVWWPVGQLVSSLVAWGFIPNYPSDKGWRYFTYTIGTLTFLMFLCRFLLIHLFESPKFLLSQGKQREAVAVVWGIAHKNNRKTWLTEDILNQVGGDPEVVEDTKLSIKEIIRRQFSKFSGERIGPLFATKKLAWTTCIVWFLWTTIGIGYPLFNAFLPQYLSGPADKPTPTRIVYRNYAINSIIGVPGSIIAYWTVDIKYIGRKGTMAIATLLTGIFLFLFTISKGSNFQLGMTCMVSFFQNVMYGVLYAYTPEVFPAPNRGTGVGIASFFNRISGLCAPIIAANVRSNPLVPLYVSGGLYLAAFVGMVLLPIETMGKQKL